jgi:hypothetical protein
MGREAARLPLYLAEMKECLKQTLLTHKSLWCFTFSKRTIRLDKIKINYFQENHYKIALIIDYIQISSSPCVFQPLTIVTSKYKIVYCRALYNIVGSDFGCKKVLIYACPKIKLLF